MNLWGWVRRWVGGAPHPSAPLNPPNDPTFHLHLPGTTRARCGARMGPATILTIEPHVVTCLPCRRDAEASKIKTATSVR